MYWRGHVGLGLLAYAPVAGVVLASGEFGLAVVGGLLAVVAAPLPDVDQSLPIPHRGPTHTLAFAVAAGVVAALAAAAVIATGAVPSHLLRARNPEAEFSKRRAAPSSSRNASRWDFEISTPMVCSVIFAMSYACHA